MNTHSLKEYRRKRKLTTSPEPKGTKKKSSKRPIFVIQKHKSRQLHYDFRLEIKGVLVSWAIPKGPSIDPRDKRLAVQTDDHPIEYARFEGIIPPGHYGAGTVMVWDKGTYRNLATQDEKKIPMTTCLKNGVIEIWLNGKKLKGGYSLIKMKNRKNQWLLIKKDDKEANARRNPISSQPDSALTNRTLKEIEKK